MKVLTANALYWGSKTLKAADLEDKQALLLLCHHKQLTRKKLMNILEEPLEDNILTNFRNDIKKLVMGIPLQYVLGYQLFCGRRFIVSKDVLIPRTETCGLIEKVLEFSKPYHRKVLDVGTGSGNLAITLKKERPSFEVTATEISEKALQIAKKNGVLHGVEIDWLQGNLLEPVKGIKYDIIIANLPYVSETDGISADIRLYQPNLALFGGADGLDLYRSFALNLPMHVQKGSIVALEAWNTQKEIIKGIFKTIFPQSIFKTIEKPMGEVTFIFIEI